MLASIWMAAPVLLVLPPEFVEESWVSWLPLQLYLALIATLLEESLSNAEQLSWPVDSILKAPFT